MRSLGCLLAGSLWLVCATDGKQQVAPASLPHTATMGPEVRPGEGDEKAKANGQAELDQSSKSKRKD